MNVDVLIPWAGGCYFRQKALEWTLDQYAARHPTWGVVFGASPAGPFNRAAAILDAASRSDADVFVVSDADVYCDPAQAVDAVNDCGWAVPHLMLHRLAIASTAVVIAGGDWHGLPLSGDNPQDSRPYKGNETGTLFVIRRDVLADVPPDVRFVGWGQEDEAYADALRTLVGKPWRGQLDLPHLWHPSQPRQTRKTGNNTSLQLRRRYARARGKRTVMRGLVDEAKALVAA